MKRLRVAFLCLAVALALVLVGCGGGGGGGGTSGGGTPDNGGGGGGGDLGGSTLSGTVVSSKTNQGVDGVVITFSAFATATTANGGKFQISLDSISGDMPIYFGVDTSGAGTNFPKTEFVTYNGQTYYPDQVDVPVAVLNGESTQLGTITVREVTDDSVPPPPYPNKDVMIYGRVVSEKYGTGIEGVVVSFGYTPTKTARTGKKGYFVINAGRSIPLELFQGASKPYTFSINTSGAVGSYPSTLKASLESVSYNQSSIAVPERILAIMDGVNIGTITILDGGTGGGGGGGNEPPPPPTF